MGLTWENDGTPQFGINTLVQFQSDLATATVNLREVLVDMQKPMTIGAPMNASGGFVFLYQRDDLVTVRMKLLNLHLILMQRPDVFGGTPASPLFGRVDLDALIDLCE